MVQMGFCELSHTFHKMVTNVSQHVLVILLWGILMSPLIGWKQRSENIQLFQNLIVLNP